MSWTPLPEAARSVSKRFLVVPRAVTFVDSDRSAIRTVKGNLEALGVQGSARVVEGDVGVLAARGGVPGAPFSLLLLDPPYRLAWCDIEGLTSSLARSGQLEDGAVIVYEHAVGQIAEWPEGFDLAARKKYGSTGIDIVVYERGAGAS